MKKNIPISWYFDNSVFEKERAHLFEKYPDYMGHRLMVPQPNDFYVLEREKKGKILFNRSDHYALISNICRHHQALLLKGNTNKIICQAHRWAYSTNGQLTNAPQFEKKPCLDLSNRKLMEWFGLLFLKKDLSLPVLTNELVAYLICVFAYCKTATI